MKFIHFQDKTSMIVISQNEESELGKSLIEKYMKIRLDFVKAMGWLPNATDDTDNYDKDPSTKYYLKLVENEIVVGMRSTKSQWKKGLSFSMINNNPKLKDQLIEKLNSNEYKQYYNHNFWDVSRLVIPILSKTDEKYIEYKRLMLPSLVQIFGLAIKETTSEDKNGLWIGCLTTKILEFLQTCGFCLEVLVSDYFTSGDDDKSHLCIGFPNLSIETMKNPNHASNGIYKLLLSPIFEENLQLNQNLSAKL
jgi:hypothetical protein